ncbi:hypothetical protein Salat_1899300 [Sesamum alatum]|uniref:Uncharacterized protein n=1 Tax=Sesamum alatum TaxID=300844 RepID=A0AAE1Y3W6_9LAMI|nr:hypothetical protein Salat_1899300 [Sesamum alatum]
MQFLGALCAKDSISDQGSDCLLPWTTARRGSDTIHLFSACFLLRCLSLPFTTYSSHSLPHPLLFCLLLWFSSRCGGSVHTLPSASVWVAACRLRRGQGRLEAQRREKDSPYGPWLRAPVPVRGRGPPPRREPVPPRAVSLGFQRGAAVFGSFQSSARGLQWNRQTGDRRIGQWFSLPRPRALARGVLSAGLV